MKKSLKFIGRYLADIIFTIIVFAGFLAAMAWKDYEKELTAHERS